MRRLFRILFVIVAVVALLIAGAIWGLNAYIQSPAFAAQVKDKVSAIAGVPVEFSDVQWDIGRGITVIGLRLEHDVPGTRPALFLCPRIHLKYDWGSLWNWCFDINELTFKEPELRVTQTPDGAYVLPYNATAAATTEAPATPALAILLRTFNVDKARIEVLDSDQRARLQLEGMRIEGTRPGGGDGADFRMQGLLKMGKVSLWETIALYTISSPFSYRNGMLSLNALEADTYDGRLVGSWEQDFNNPAMPYNLTLNAEGVSVSRFVGEALGRPGLLNGKLEASTVWLGPATEPKDVTGHGTAEITNGQVINLPFFRRLAALLGNLPVLAQPDFSQAKMDFRVAGQKLEITGFILKSALFELSGQGTIGFDLIMDGAGKLALNPQLTRQVPAELRGVLETREDGYSVIPLKITGTVDNPKVTLAADPALMNRAVNTLFNLFGPGAKKDQDQPQTPSADGQATPPAATPATPAP